MRLLLPRELVFAAAHIAEFQGQSFHTYLAGVLRSEISKQSPDPLDNSSEMGQDVQKG